MKKVLFIALAAFALFSCEKEQDVKVEKESQSLKFAFNVADKPSFDGDTRAVKTRWESGDRIYLVFDDVCPTKLADLTILQYDGTEWAVAQEGNNKPSEAGGTLDALYYDNPTLRPTYNNTSDGGEFLFGNDVDYGKYMFLNQANVPYSVSGGVVEADLSLDFEPNNVRTYVQFCIKGIDADEWQVAPKDYKESSNSIGTWGPEWQALNARFTYDSFPPGYYLYMGNRSDGAYLYATVWQQAETWTFGLNKRTGDYQGLYLKTFSKQISGKCAAITFTGPQFDADGNVTNGWKNIIAFRDAEVKRICIENWDTDGDGMLSKEEARAVTVIPTTAFSGNTTIKSFEELQYFTGLTEITATCFLNCTSLQRVVIPEGVKRIGNGAFNGCTSLKWVEIPATVTEIKQQVFAGDTGLEYIIFKSYAPPSIYANTFPEGIYCLYVPAERTAAYLAAENWSDFADNIQGYSGFNNTEAYVDLGNGHYWATANLGTKSPTASGSYYAWGEYLEKDEYSVDTYDYSAKYYDVASLIWGPSWHTPSTEDFEWLMENCTWTRNEAKNGMTVTGPNGNSIFLPQAGYKTGSQFGWYWSSTEVDGNTRSAFALFFASDKDPENYPIGKYFGMPVRAVFTMSE